MSLKEPSPWLSGARRLRPVIAGDTGEGGNMGEVGNGDGLASSPIEDANELDR